MVRRITAVATPNAVYRTSAAEKVTQTPLAPVTASLVRMTSYTTHGWRPTSVTIQPDSRATTAATPETATARRNHGVRGMSRRRHHAHASHRRRTISALQIPTMVSNAQWSIVLAGGRSFGGTVSRPVTFVSVLHPTRNESKPGIPIPPLTPEDVQRP